MAEMELLRLTLALIIGTLAAIVYSIRVLILVERRVARIEEHLESLVNRVLAEEYKLEKKIRRR